MFTILLEHNDETIKLKYEISKNKTLQNSSTAKTQNKVKNPLNNGIMYNDKH